MARIVARIGSAAAALAAAAMVAALVAGIEVRDPPPTTTPGLGVQEFPDPPPEKDRG
ncbi:hypothetical protein [Phytohabitans kaempferiae]|uniref:Uncharacterized protein n=1 Tax=Phytohabitans kaempferiae TaxID=1620943 RepID=A0ABV6MCY2_9ACTN